MANPSDIRRVSTMSILPATYRSEGAQDTTTHEGDVEDIAAGSSTKKKKGKFKQRRRIYLADATESEHPLDYIFDDYERDVEDGVLFG